MLDPDGDPGGGSRGADDELEPLDGAEDDDLDGWKPQQITQPPDQAGQGDQGEQDGGKPERSPRFAHPGEFFEEYLSKLIERRLGGTHTWCSIWWAHPEGLARVTAMWESWEHHRHEGALGMSTWLLHHADPHLNILLSKDNGPFASCRPDKHVRADPLPGRPADPALWAASAFTDPDVPQPTADPVPAVVQEAPNPG